MCFNWVCVGVYMCIRVYVLRESVLREFILVCVYVLDVCRNSTLKHERQMRWLFYSKIEEIKHLKKKSFFEFFCVCHTWTLPCSDNIFMVMGNMWQLHTCITCTCVMLRQINSLVRLLSLLITLYLVCSISSVVYIYLHDLKH